LDISQSIALPESDFSEVLGSGSDFEGKGLMMRYAVDLEEEVIQGDSAIRVCGALDAQAEEVFG